jgi:hypothetical protein
MHTDHLFWSKLNVEGTELHFDPIAAQAQPPAVVTTDDLVGVDITAFRTRNGEPLLARSFSADYAAPAGTLWFDCEPNHVRSSEQLRGLSCLQRRRGRAPQRRG